MGSIKKRQIMALITALSVNVSMLTGLTVINAENDNSDNIFSETNEKTELTDNSDITLQDSVTKKFDLGTPENGGNYKFIEAEVEEGFTANTITFSVDNGSIRIDPSDDYRIVRDLSDRTLLVIFKNSADSATVQKLIRENVTFAAAVGDTQRIRITIDGNETNIPENANITIAEIDGQEHAYMYVNEELNWSDAYNKAKGYKYKGLRGYLTTITSSTEDSILDNITLRGGWSGGSRYHADTYDSVKAPSGEPNGNEWFRWACGPEAGQAYYKYTSVGESGGGKGAIEGYYQNFRNSAEPNNYDVNGANVSKNYDEGNYEWCMQVHQVFEGGYSWNDLSDDVLEYAPGYFVEFSEYGEENQINQLQVNAASAHIVVQPEGPAPVTISGITLDAEKDYDGTAAAFVGTPEAHKSDGSKVDIPNFEYKWYKGEELLSGAPKNAGTYKLVVSIPEDNRHYEGSAEYTITIKRIPVNITGISVKANKVYDGTASAEIQGTPEITNMVSGDSVSISNGTATFDNKNVGTDKTVSFTGFEITGAAKDNYELSAQPESVKADIAKKEVTLSGVLAQNKVYDGNANASIFGDISIVGKVDGDDLSTVTGTASFDSKEAGTGKTVSFTGFSLAGASKGNYELSSQPESIKADITKKPVTITGVLSQDKVYDGNTEASIVGDVSTDGKINGDDLNVVTGTASFDSKEAGTGKTVSFTGFSLAGASKDNYELFSQPASVKADIKRNRIGISWSGIEQREYDGTPSNITALITGVVDGDIVEASVTGGNETSVGTHTATATLIGNSAPNYELPENESIEYVIEKAGLSISNVTIESKPYDGTPDSLYRNTFSSYNQQ